MNKFNFCKVNQPSDLLSMNVQNTIVTINYLLYITRGVFEFNKEELQADNRFDSEDKMINTGVFLRPLLFSYKKNVNNKYISYLNIPINQINKYLNHFSIDNCCIEPYYESEHNKKKIISINNNFSDSFALPIQSKVLMNAVNSAYQFKQNMLFFDMFDNNKSISILKKHLFNS